MPTIGRPSTAAVTSANKKAYGSRSRTKPKNNPAKVIAEPSGLFIGSRGPERVGDVSNVVFTNGAIAKDNGEVYIYYASSDTRLHVAATTIDRLIDYVFNTPEDPLRSPDCVRQRCALVEKNKALLTSN